MDFNEKRRKLNRWQYQRIKIGRFVMAFLMYLAIVFIIAWIIERL